MTSLQPDQTPGSDKPLTGPRIIRRGLWRQRRRVGLSALLVGISRGGLALVPVAVGLIVDQVMLDGDWSRFGVALLVLGLLFLCIALSWQWCARLIIYAIADEEHRLRIEISGRVLHPQSLRSGLRSGEVLTIASADARNTAVMLEFTLLVTEAVASLALGAGVLLSIDLVLGLVILVGTPVVMILLRLGSPAITRRTTRQQEHAARTAAVATDVINGLRPLAGIGGQATAASHFGEVSQTALKVRLHAAKAVAIFDATAAAATGLLVAGVTALAGWFAFEGRISIGELITIIGLAQFLLLPLQWLGDLPGVWARGRASADRVAQILTAPSLLPDVGQPISTHTGVQAAGLAHKSLNGLELHARPGELLAVLVTDPRDAEALAEALSGQVDPSEYAGAVVLGDGVAVAEADLDHLREALVSEPHLTDIFTGTIGQNITMGSTLEDHDGAVASAISAASADDVIDGQPDGVDHQVQDRGANLSGGQRQRIALARALANDPPILVLHDPTTAVDAVTEHAIAAGIRDMRHRPGADRTTIIITSSPALLAVADRVVVIEGGVANCEGTHSALMDEHPGYREAVQR